MDVTLLTHGDQVIVTLGKSKYSARIECRMKGQYPSKEEEMYLCIPGRMPIPIVEWEGTIELDNP
jgi:hypothetical protein